MDKQIFTSVPFEDLIEAMRKVVKEELAATPQTTRESLEKPITGKELCSFLGISGPTLIRWRNKGKIPFLEIGGALRYDKNKVHLALEVQKKGGKL
jgi:excisionase family DNA binding protein